MRVETILEDFISSLTDPHHAVIDKDLFQDMDLWLKTLVRGDRVVVVEELPPEYARMFDCNFKFRFYISSVFQTNDPDYIRLKTGLLFAWKDFNGNSVGMKNDNGIIVRIYPLNSSYDSGLQSATYESFKSTLFDYRKKYPSQLMLISNIL